MVSTEKIYQYIRENKGKGGDLYQYLRHKLKHRKQLPFLRRGEDENQLVYALKSF